METETLVQVGSYKKFCPTTILMLKAEVNYTQIYLEDGSKYLSSTTLGILEKRLKNYQFFRPNRSIIINLNYLADFEINDKTFDFLRLKIENTTPISVSRRKKNLLLKTLESIT